MASIGLACISFGVLLSNNNLVSVNAQEDRLKAPLMTYTNGDAATYYNSIDSSKSGNALLSDLYSLNHSKRKSAVGYKEMGTSPSGMFKYTDYDPSTVQYDTNGQPYGTKILSFYSGTSTTSWNREHVWPNSRGGGSGGNAGSDWLPDADIFMPRPTISSENSNRGNSKYVEGMKSSSDGWDPVTAFGVDGCYLNSTSVRGECARIIFYCMTVNNNLVLDDTNNGGTTGVTMGKLSDLLKWNLENPVNQREINRNEGGEYLQGNRNAFVDHPEYACKIWGNYNENTKRICGASEEAPTTITLTVDKEVVAVGDKANITVSVDKGSSQVVWDSSDKTVATVSNGVVSTIKAGVTEISARSALDPNVVGKITITVKAVKELSYTGTPTKTSYKSGEYFDSTGLTVTATFTDSSTENVTSLVTWEPSPLYQGLTEVTGKYAGKSVKVSGLTVAKADPIATKTITFRSNGSDDNNSMTDDQVKAEIIEGAEEVSSISNAVNVYKGKIGLKLGKSSATGSLEINLKNTFTDVKQIKVKAAQYGSDTSGLIINDQTIEIDSSEETEYTIDITGNVSTISIKSSPKRAYLSSITIVTNDEGGGEDTTIHVSSVALDKHSLELKSGDTVTLTATVLPENATNKAITWLSTNEEVAIVNNGVVTAKNVGYARIIAKSVDGNITDECEVTVINNGEEPLPKPKKGCNGSIIASSVVVSSTSLAGLTILFFRKKREK